MAITELSCKDSDTLRTKDKAAVFVDVRSAEEYAAGHPEGALNVPIMHKGPAGMSPNPDFLAVVTAVVPRDKKVLVSCLSGGRSMRACQLMEQNGYKDLVNVRGGFGGARDMSGQIVEPGWQAQGLPTESGPTADRSYEALKKRAGKK